MGLLSPTLDHKISLKFLYPNYFYIAEKQMSAYATICDTVLNSRQHNF